MKKMKCFRLEEPFDEKIKIEARRQRLLTGENVTDSDLMRFYIEKGLKEKPKYSLKANE